MTVTFIAAVLIAAGVFYSLVDLLDFQEIDQTAKLDATTLFDLVKLSFGVVAGAGALVALVVAYRRQRVDEAGAHREATRLHTERFTQAVEQLGSDSPAVRLGGVHALAGLADDAPDTSLRQTCIDVLCAYLQLPYTPDPGADPAHQEERRRYLAFRKVRHTILRLIGDHYRRPHGTHRSWQSHDLDLTGVTIDGSMDFRGAVFSDGTVSFDSAVFSGGTVLFDSAVFSGGTVSFDSAVFSGGTVSFDSAVFSEGAVSFDSARFLRGGVSFHSTVFSGGTVRFDSAVFFDGPVLSDRPVLGRMVLFATAKFTGGRVTFDYAKFNDGTVSFDSAWFTGGEVTFHHAEFNHGTVPFDHAKLLSGSTVSFVGARFTGSTLSFYSTDFSGGTMTFGGPMNPLRAEFIGGTLAFEWATGPAPDGLLASLPTHPSAMVSLPIAWVPSRP